MSKPKYDSHVKPRLAEIEAWARDGVREKDMAHNLNVAMSAFSRYKNDHKELREALAKGKDYVDNVIVTNAFLKRVTGYDATEVRKEYAYKPNEDGEMEKILIKEVSQTKHIPGDPRAAEFWLKNRQPDKWVHVPTDLEEEKKGGVVIIPAVKEVTP